MSPGVLVRFAPSSVPQPIKVAALPAAGGGVLELHIPLDDITTVDGMTGLINRTELEQAVKHSVALMARLRSEAVIFKK